MNNKKVILEDVFNAIKSLNLVPDKHQWKTTTSKLFKINLLQLLTKKSKMKWIELGGAQGHTTLILSYIAETVLSIDFDDENCKKINALGKENITTKAFDLYGEDFKNYMKENKFDAAFIDAIHDEEHVKIDISNCVNAGVKLFVFDDYGGFEGVRSAVNNFIISLEKDKIHHRVSYVGMHPGALFNNTHYKVLQDWEGVIIELIE